MEEVPLPGPLPVDKTSMADGDPPRPHAKPSHSVSRLQANKRHLMHTFPTLHHDKRPPLARDGLRPNYFDHQLVVEKAQFDAPSLATDDGLLHLPDDILSSSASTTGGYLKPPLPPSNTTPRKDNKNTKKKKRPSQPTSRPAEVFHRNLIDAVSNAEESDENEHYVYPYDYHTDISPALHRVRSMPLSDIRRQEQRWFATQPRRLDDPTEQRLMLRSHVLDPKFAIDSPWLESRPRGVKRFSRRSPRLEHDQDGYTSDDEAVPLLRFYRPMSRGQGCAFICAPVLLGMVVMAALMFSMALYLVTPLTDVSIELGRVLASDKELIFDLHVQANNWNWWPVRIADADIGVFALSQIVPLSVHNASEMYPMADPAEYLGSFYHFDEPLYFPSSRFGSDTGPVAQIRIKSPGADTSGNERWSRMIRYPYQLVTRGVLKYRPMPFVPLYPQSVAICEVANVDPTTGKASEEPDQSYCFKEDSLKE